MENPEYNVSDLVNFAALQKPAEFETAFNSLMQSRAAEMINDRKIELARGLFNSNDAEISDEENLEVADETEEDNSNGEEA